jgi:hypothetical protein
MSKNNKIVKFLLSPVAVVFYISIILLLINIYLLQKTRPFTSDDLSWQNILLSWQPFHHQTVYLGGSDNYVIKAPFFKVMSYLFSPTRHLLVIEAAILAVVTLGLFYFSSIYFLLKAKIKLSYLNLIPFMWFASFGFGMANLYLSTVLRNIEIGFSFVVFALAAMIYYKDVHPFKTKLSSLISVIVAVVIGMFIYNDTYFLYFTIGPIVILFGILYLLRKINKTQLLSVVGLTVVSFIAGYLTRTAVIHLGFKSVFAEPIQFVSFSGLGNNISLGVHGLIVLFGGDIFGRNVINLVTFAAIANLALLLYIIFSMVRQMKPADQNATTKNINPFLYFFGCLSIFVFIVYVLSNLAVNIDTYRYLMMFAFTATLFICIKLAQSKKINKAVYLLMIISIVLNLYAAIKFTQTGGTNKANTQNYQLIALLKDQGLTKGYAPYWDGSINSYLSGGKITALPITCAAAKTEPLDFLINTSEYNVSSKKSFYIVDPDLASPPTCTEKQVIAQFGQPSKQVSFYDKTILIYNYDIVTKM